MDLLLELKAANPLFRMTAFCVQGRGSDEYWDSLPDWIELAGHGHVHSSPREAETWTYEQTMEVLLAKPQAFKKGWKSPGWQVSDGTYMALMDMDFWIADHWGNNYRRPEGIMAHVISEAAGAGADPEHLHLHVDDVCGNGIAESFSGVLSRVTAARSFSLISESVSAWRPLVAA